MRKASEAAGLFLPSGAWRPLAAVPTLEEEYGKPVFTHDSSRVWQVIHDGHAPAVSGWGRLLASP